MDYQYPPVAEMVISPSTFKPVRIEKRFSQAQVQTLNSVPQSLIPAQGPGTIVIPVLTIVRSFQAVGYTANATLFIRHNGSALALSGLCSGVTMGVIDNYFFLMPNANAAGFGIQSVIPNADVLLISTADVAGGDPTNRISIVSWFITAPVPSVV